ncbi:MAG: hypothetical protein KAW87_05515 [Candidatus Cloacimonetes bacterium]|nr:hypothetical protein [Candidatus Cloacimonadota bacterium]
MGKLLIICILLICTILASILISVQRHTGEVPIVVTQDLAERQARALGNYALQYGIKELMAGNVTFSDSITGYIKDFTTWEVLDGSIDSIRFTNEADGSIRINSFVTYNIIDEAVKHESEATFLFILDDESPINIIAAIVSGGSITIHAKAVITGDVTESTEFNFEEIFGMSEEAVRNEAISNNAFISNPANNEPMPDSLTWMDGDFKITSDWTGSGILIINGNLKCTAHMAFEGILVIFGELEITAHSDITGSVFVVGDTSLGAHATITFDSDIIADAFESLPFEVSLKIINWDEN